MTVEIANPWEPVLGAVSITTLVTLYTFRKRFKPPSKVGVNRFFWQFRWLAIFALSAGVIALALVTGLHRLFIGVSTKDDTILLDYPWPQTDVSLNRKDITGAEYERRRFRFRYMYRVEVQTAAESFVRWSGHDEVLRAVAAIRDRGKEEH